MPFLSLVTLPSASTLLASSSDWSAPIFTDLLPFVYLAVGVFVAIGLLAFIPGIFAKVFHH